MKNLKLILLFVFSPLCIFAQQQLSGLWIGNLTNDSTSVRKDESFEIVLSQYKEKVYGYSRTTFMVRDTLYYIVKRVKGTINGDVCEVKDDHVISNNFPKRIEKGVKVISTFRRNLADSTWYLEGDWKTTKTKKYYAVSGKVDLKEEKDYTKSKLYPHLEELGLEKDVPVFAAVKAEEEKKIAKAKEAIVKTTAPTETKLKAPTTAPSKNEAIKTEQAIVKTEVKQEPQKEEIIQEKMVEPTLTKPITGNTTVKTIPNQSGDTKSTAINKPVDQITKLIEKPAASNPKQVVNPESNNNTTSVNSTEVAKSTPAAKTQPVPEEIPFDKPLNNNKPVTATSSPLIKQSNTTVTQTEAIAKKQPVMTNEKTVSPAPRPVTSENPVNKSRDLSAPAALIALRKTEAPQMVQFVSDSLVLALYDNGEVDGDTVSVLLNNDIFISKQVLKTSAIRKTLYITPGNEEFTLILYAENLGKYPPNTGLLVIYDGEERHQLRFSADLQKNASVVFKKKKRE